MPSTSLLKMLDKAFEYDNQSPTPWRLRQVLQRLPATQWSNLAGPLHPARRALQQAGRPQGDAADPSARDGILLRRAGLDARAAPAGADTSALALEKNKVQETLFLVLGQDFKTVAGHSKGGHRGKGRGYAAFYGDDEADPSQWDESYDYDAEDYSVHYEYDEYYTEYNDSPTHYESPSHHGYYEEDTTGFDDDAAYYGDEVPPVDPQEQAEEYDSAFAAYLDARKRFNDSKLARGYLPIVALSEAGAGLSPGISPTASPSSSPGRGKGKGKPKGKNKGKGGRTTVKYPPRGPGKA